MQASPRADAYSSREIALDTGASDAHVSALIGGRAYVPYDEALRTERDLFPALWAAEPHLQAVERFLQRKK